MFLYDEDNGFSIDKLQLEDGETASFAVYHSTQEVADCMDSHLELILRYQCNKYLT